MNRTLVLAAGGSREQTFDLRPPAVGLARPEPVALMILYAVSSLWIHSQPDDRAG